MSIDHDRPVGKGAVARKDNGVVRLRVIGGFIDLRDDVPATRADCPKERPCGHVRCRYHLYRVDADDRSGRRGGNRKRLSTMREVWLEWPLPPSCTLDFVDAHASGAQHKEIARALPGWDPCITESRVWQLEHSAWKKIRTRYGDAVVRDIVAWLSSR